MRFSSLVRQRRRRFISESKQADYSESSGFSESKLSDFISSGLTKIKSDDTIKKHKEILTFDQEGNIKKFQAGKTKRIKNKNSLFDINNLSLGYYLLIPIIAGVFLGLGLDYWFRTKPFLFIVSLFLGTVASFYNLFKLTKAR